MKTSPIFNQLEWKQTSTDYWLALTPSSVIKKGYIAISYEHGKYWPIWDCSLPAYDTLDEAKYQGQLCHENFLKIYINKEYLK